jgi:hypothetical protein
MPSTSKSQPEPRKQEAHLLRLLVAAIYSGPDAHGSSDGRDRSSGGRRSAASPCGREGQSSSFTLLRAHNLDAHLGVMLGCRFDQPAVAAPSDEIKTLRKQLTQKARKWPERALTVLFGRG